MIANYLHVVEDIRARYPEAWRQAHTGSSQTHDFVKLLAARLHALDSAFGLLGQYGNAADLAEDVVCYLGEGPGYDVITGRPISAFDVIVGAGGPGARPAWNFINQGGGVAWVAPWGAVPAPVPVPPTPPPQATQPPGREEALDELRWLDAYYASPEGLQRSDGLSLNGKPDFEGVAAWYLDVYQRERMAMKSRADARAAYVSKIRHSGEWQAKHPGDTP